MKRSTLVLSLSALLIIVPSFATADEVAKGKELYNGIGACAVCHGPEGAGDGPAGAALNPKPRSFQTGELSYDTDGDGMAGTKTDIMNIIEHGAAKYGGSMLMAARPDLKEDQRAAIAEFILSLKN